MVPDDQSPISTIQALERQVTELQEAVAARDTFLAVAAHELRNPMTPILAQVQRLKRIADLPGGQSHADLAHGLGRLEKLVGHYVRRATTLLDVSRMTTGKLTLRYETFDLCVLVRETVELMMPAAQHMGSTIALHAPEALRVRMDPLAIEQILDNLISNGVKYGQGRPIELHVWSNAGTIRIEVRDRGVGISPADQARIFSRFERAVSQGSSVGGFGVGLWVVGQLTEAMGGRIEVSSAPGEGSVFTLHLPNQETEER